MVRGVVTAPPPSEERSPADGGPLGFLCHLHKRVVSRNSSAYQSPLTAVSQVLDIFIMLRPSRVPAL